MDTDTIIVVATTRIDGSGNLWVAPKGDGDEVKIAAKRSNLHPLFQQGKAILLDWQTYLGKSYVANAKLVEGELPPDRDQRIIDTKPVKTTDIRIQEQVAIKEVGECYRNGIFKDDNTLVVAYKIWLLTALDVSKTPKPASRKAPAVAPTAASPLEDEEPEEPT